MKPSQIKKINKEFGDKVKWDYEWDPEHPERIDDYMTEIALNNKHPVAKQIHTWAGKEKYHQTAIDLYNPEIQSLYQIGREGKFKLKNAINKKVVSEDDIEFFENQFIYGVIIPDDTLIYKGFEYFYTPEQEEEYYSSHPTSPNWYSNIVVASSYSNLYNGGLNVYKVAKKIRLIEFNNSHNLQMIIDYITLLIGKVINNIITKKYSREELINIKQ